MAMNLVKIQDSLKDFSDRDLMNEARNPSGMIPSFLVVSEFERRSRLRKAASQQQPPSSTVADDLEREAEPQAPQGIASIMPQQAPQGAIQEMARGGIVRMAGGGDAWYDPTAERTMLEKRGYPKELIDQYLKDKASGAGPFAPSNSVNAMMPGMLDTMGFVGPTPTQEIDPEMVLPFYDQKAKEEYENRVEVHPWSEYTPPAQNASIQPPPSKKSTSPAGIDSVGIDGPPEYTAPLRTAISSRAGSSGSAGINQLRPPSAQPSSVQQRIMAPFVNEGGYRDATSDSLRVGEDRMSELYKRLLDSTPSAKDRRQDALNMAMIQAGLGMMGSKSSDFLTSVAQGAMPAMQSLASNLQDIRKEDRENILTHLKIQQEENTNAYRRGMIDVHKFDTNTKLAIAQANRAAHLAGAQMSVGNRLLNMLQSNNPQERQTALDYLGKGSSHSQKFMESIIKPLQIEKAKKLSEIRDPERRKKAEEYWNQQIANAYTMHQPLDISSGASGNILGSFGIE